ncbi:MAG: metal-dependent hydrolase [Firmicutes bacterium]|jgi:L-ascorbate metabolism protein UlaG (beta-lactamase superfamily)|nr:metal-dependent hydrolase [Bacillota bacterium]NLO66018.1 metal-dependent hydrolase [Bacillota bacterium]
MSNQVRWLGHAAFEITSAQGKRILIDPWITGNPLCPVKVEELAGPDLVLITHDHHDHYGSDLPRLLGGGKGILVGQPEVMAKAKQDGVEKEQIITGGSGMNIGGTVEIDGIKVTMTQAVHSSQEAGSPCGFIVTLEDGTVIYHAGDTGIFSSMELFGRLYEIDVALLPIGSVFVMDPEQAALALKLLQPKIAVPMHFLTFPALEQSADNFIAAANRWAPGVRVEVLQPGESLFAEKS